MDWFAHDFGCIALPDQVSLSLKMRDLIFALVLPSCKGSISPDPAHAEGVRAQAQVPQLHV